MVENEVNEGRRTHRNRRLYQPSDYLVYNLWKFRKISRDCILYTSVLGIVVNAAFIITFLLFEKKLLPSYYWIGNFNKHVIALLVSDFVAYTSYIIGIIHECPGGLFLGFVVKVFNTCLWFPVSLGSALIEKKSKNGNTVRMISYFLWPVVNVILTLAFWSYSVKQFELLERQGSHSSIPSVASSRSTYTERSTIRTTSTQSRGQQHRVSFHISGQEVESDAGVNQTNGKIQVNQTEREILTNLTVVNDQNNDERTVGNTDRSETSQSDPSGSEGRTNQDPAKRRTV